MKNFPEVFFSGVMESLSEVLGSHNVTEKHWQLALCIPSGFSFLVSEFNLSNLCMITFYSSQTRIQDLLLLEKTISLFDGT